MGLRGGAPNWNASNLKNMTEPPKTTIDTKGVVGFSNFERPLEVVVVVPAGKERARPPACWKNPLCAARKPSPFPFGAGTRPEEKKRKWRSLDYMGESPGRTSL